MCIFNVCVCVHVRICLEYVYKMNAEKLTERTKFIPKIKKKKLRHYFQHEASCSLVPLCADLPPRTWQFCGKAKAELDPLCRCCRICIITNIKKICFRNIFSTVQAKHWYSLVHQMSSLKAWAKALPLCLGKLIIWDQRKSQLFGG